MSVRIHELGQNLMRDRERDVQLTQVSEFAVHAHVGERKQQRDRDRFGFASCRLAESSRHLDIA